jgi:hypothetical protein
MLFVSLRATRPSAQGTGGEFTAWLPASHQASRSLNSCTDTYLRAGLVMGWIIPIGSCMSSYLSGIRDFVISPDVIRQFPGFAA